MIRLRMKRTNYTHIICVCSLYIKQNKTENLFKQNFGQIETKVEANYSLGKIAL